MLAADETLNKEYLSMGGLQSFTDAATRLVLGEWFSGTVDYSLLTSLVPLTLEQITVMIHATILSVVIPELNVSPLLHVQ